MGDSKTGRQWLGAIIRLNADASAVYDNPDYQAAYAQLEGVVDALADARKALRGTLHSLAAGGPVDGLRALLHGVEETKRDVLAPDGKLYALPAFERHTWGAVPQSDGGFIFQA